VKPHGGAGIAHLCSWYFLAAVASSDVRLPDDLLHRPHLSSTAIDDLAGTLQVAPCGSGQGGFVFFSRRLLVWPATGWSLPMRAQDGHPVFAYASVVIAAVQHFFLLLEFRCPSVCLMTGTSPGGRARAEPAAAISPKW